MFTKNPLPFYFTEKHSHSESDPSHLHSNGEDDHAGHDNSLEVTSKYNIKQIPLQGERKLLYFTLAKVIFIGFTKLSKMKKKILEGVPVGVDQMLIFGVK